MKQTKTIIALSLGLILGIGSPLYAQTRSQQNTAKRINDVFNKQNNETQTSTAPKNNPPENSQEDQQSISNKSTPPSSNPSEQNTGNEFSGSHDIQNGNSNNTGSTAPSKKKTLDDAILFVEKFINDEGIDTEWSGEDRSINFKDPQKGTLFWITFDDNNKNPEGKYLYTLHTQSIRPRPDKNEEKVAENLIYAANYITQNAPYKAIYKEDDRGGKIELIYPIYASNPEDFCNVLFLLTETMKDPKQLFEKGIEEGKEINDALHYKWQYQTDNKKVIPGDKDQLKSTIKINNIQVKGSRYENGQLEDRIGYGNNMQRSLFDYITPKIEYEFTGDKNNGPKGWQLEIQLIDPSGKVCVYDEKLNYTEKAYVPFSKKGEFDLPKIGSKGYSWDTGLYEIKIFENGKEIKGVKFYVDE